MCLLLLLLWLLKPNDYLALAALNREGAGCFRRERHPCAVDFLTLVSCGGADTAGATLIIILGLMDVLALAIDVNDYLALSRKYLNTNVTTVPRGPHGHLTRL